MTGTLLVVVEVLVMSIRFQHNVKTSGDADNNLAAHARDNQHYHSCHNKVDLSEDEDEGEDTWTLKNHNEIDVDVHIDEGNSNELDHEGSEHDTWVLRE